MTLHPVNPNPWSRSVPLTPGMPARDGSAEGGARVMQVTMPSTPPVPPGVRAPEAPTVRSRPSDSAIGHFVAVTESDARDRALKMPMQFAFGPRVTGTDVLPLSPGQFPKEPPALLSARLREGVNAGAVDGQTLSERAEREPDPAVLRKRAQQRTNDLMFAVGGRVVTVEIRNSIGMLERKEKLRSDFDRMAMALNEANRAQSCPPEGRPKAIAERDKLLKNLSQANKALTQTLIRLSSHPALVANDELRTYLDRESVGSHNELFRVFHVQYSSRVADLLNVIVEKRKKPRSQDRALGELQKYSDNRISRVDEWIRRLSALDATPVHGPLRASFSSKVSLRDPKVRAEIKTVIAELRQLRRQLVDPKGLAAQVKLIAERAPEPADIDPLG